jgi:TldD protein
MYERILADLKKKGADYADLRHVAVRREHIQFKNGKVERVSDVVDEGVGIRALYKGSWGFSSSCSLDEGELEEVAGEALEIAKASHMTQREAVVLDEQPVYRDSYSGPVEKDPFTVPLSEKIDLLRNAVELMQKTEDVKVAQGHLMHQREKKIFVSSAGSVIQQMIFHSGGGISATAISNGERQQRSYPCSFGQFSSGGFEITEGLGLVENAERTGQEASQLLKADECPAGKSTIIIEPSQLALQVHESCGHPIELDRVFGSEAAYFGTSFLDTSKMGGFKYGSDVVNIVADATAPGGLGTFGYDDEGVKACRSEIVTNGIFKGYITSRETAPKIGQNSNGAMRADGWNRIPLVRMTNINLLPGSGSFDDLLADTADGILLSTNKSWSIDQKRLNFQFGCEIAWEIENGKLTRMLKNPVYTGITPEFWGACDAICGEEEWVLWGIPNCGKGKPGQTAHVGHGTSPARFRNIEVGVEK